ncbi:DUF3077 domain-containing protein [Pseudomonas sp. CYM-20-01]|uniref:DUF6124 family protein n=1 Tax=Pseudomonas sp. CYM-20-01 TaxID=2870750 RepID=UPI0020C07AF9|nr:DUF3077 domain-containing protein [Pseudomonas sp. CYM-20-01]
MKRHELDDIFSNSVFSVKPGLSSEEALVNASELLASASAMANEQAFASSGTQRLQTFGLAQIIESAMLLVNAALDERVPTSNPST